MGVSKELLLSATCAFNPEKVLPKEQDMPSVESNSPIVEMSLYESELFTTEITSSHLVHVPEMIWVNAESVENYGALTAKKCWLYRNNKMNFLIKNYCPVDEKVHVLKNGMA